MLAKLTLGEGYEGKSDLAGLGSSTPIVVFAHIPVWMVFEKWGWGTNDGAQALALLKRFGSIAAMPGHNRMTCLVSLGARQCLQSLLNLLSIQNQFACVTGRSRAGSLRRIRA
jgi:hypothetical protein